MPRPPLAKAPDGSESGDEVAKRCSETRLGAMAEDTSVDALFPMYVVSVKDLLSFDRIPMHEELLEKGLLKSVGEEDVVHFVSQRWHSWGHPDPFGVKLRLFQSVCRTILNDDPRTLFDSYDWEAFTTGSTLAKTFQALSTELTRDAQRLTVETFRQSILDGYVWWDYISVPQKVLEDGNKQKQAINSIPHYIERSAYFWVVVPEARHANTGALLGYEDWQSRGWCRLEEWGNFLSKRVAPPLIVTEAPHIGVVDTMDFLSIRSGIGGLARHAACKGCFSCCELNHQMKMPDGSIVPIHCDKEQVEHILTKMLPSKIDHYKRTGKAFMQTFVRNCAYSVYAGSSFCSPPTTVSQLLLDVRADTVHSNYEGLTPLTWACTYGSAPLVRELLSEGARADQSVTILQCAMQSGNAEVLQMLLDSGHLSKEALCKGSPKANITSLDRGAKSGSAACVKCLLAAGASPNPVRKDNGHTPLHTAAEGGHADVVEALLQAGAEVDATDTRGRTPLLLASQRLTLFGNSAGKAVCARHLLMARADPDLKDEQGRSPVDVVTEEGNDAVFAVFNQMECTSLVLAIMAGSL